VIGIESLTLEGGGSVEDLDLDFTLPGYPTIELKVVMFELVCTLSSLPVCYAARWKGPPRHYS